MIQKHKLVNTLFILGLPVFGIGNYLMYQPGFTWTAGLVFAVIPYTAIVAFHVLDVMVRGSFTPVVNRTFWICFAAILSMIVSLFVGLHYHSPVLKMSNSLAMVLEFSVPLFASIIVHVYNLHRDDFNWLELVLKSMLALEAVNLLGVAAGLHNVLHSFEGRISWPFMLGIYESAHLMAFLNLMLLFYMRDFKNRPLRFVGVIGLYLLNMAMMMSVNSRLSFMTFFAITILFVTTAIRAVRGLYTISLFTMPLMMSFALLIYQILSLPIFVAILERVDKEDVTTFNGRTSIWESGFDWAFNDRRGLIFGNGFQGQARLNLLDHVAELWGENDSYNIHMHSAFLQTLLGQGLVGLVLFYLVYWHGYKRYRIEYMNNTALAPAFAAFVYMLFCWQIEISFFGYNFGFVFLMLLMAPWCIKPSAVTGRRKALTGEWLA